MGELIYRELINDMTWSYSRVKTFYDCPYRWFLKYIYGCKEVPMFYSSYGSFMHKLLEQFYKGELTKEQMRTKFLFDFKDEVKGERPQASTVQKYIQCGLDYLEQFQPLPYNMIAVEKKVEFEINGNFFVGFLDYLGEKDGKLYIVDHKSRDLKPRSKRTKPTVKDQELDEMLRQLYIYSAAIKQEYGVFPAALCFNCFKTQTFIEEPFKEEAYIEALDWVTEQIEDIKNADEFYPRLDYFSCMNICGMKDECCYYDMR